MAERTFVVTVKEPADDAAPHQVGTMLQFEFDRDGAPPGLKVVNASTIQIYLRSDAGIEIAERIAGLLNEFGRRVKLD